jgi:hypothetical protein
VTVEEFLSKTDIPLTDIAKEVGSHLARVYAWRSGKSIPGGRHLARLILISGNRITVRAVAGKPTPKTLARKTA